MIGVAIQFIPMNNNRNPYLLALAGLFLLVASLSFVLLFGGCAAPIKPQTTGLTIVTYQNQPHAIVPVPMKDLKVGDIVAYRDGQITVAGRLLQARGDGVFRVENQRFVLLTEANYVGRLIPFSP